MQHTAREDQIFSFILAFLTGIWPARHLKRRYVARGQKWLPAPDLNGTWGPFANLEGGSFQLARVASQKIKKAKFAHRQFQKRPNSEMGKRPNKGQIF